MINCLWNEGYLHVCWKSLVLTVSGYKSKYFTHFLTRTPVTWWVCYRGHSTSNQRHSGWTNGPFNWPRYLLPSGYDLKLNAAKSSMRMTTTNKITLLVWDRSLNLIKIILFTSSYNIDLQISRNNFVGLTLYYHSRRWKFWLTF